VPSSPLRRLHHVRSGGQDRWALTPLGERVWRQIKER
jgi:hypothetical protein